LLSKQPGFPTNGYTHGSINGTIIRIGAHGISQHTANIIAFSRRPRSAPSPIISSTRVDVRSATNPVRAGNVWLLIEGNENDSFTVVAAITAARTKLS
jgi:hypothetical protein